MFISTDCISHEVRICFIDVAAILHRPTVSLLGCPAHIWAIIAIHDASMRSQHGCMLQAEAKAWRGEVETVTRCGHLAGAAPAPQQCVRCLLSLLRSCCG